MAKFILYVRTNKVGSKCEMELDLPDEDALNEDGTVNAEAVDEMAREYLSNLMEWGWERTDEVTP